MSRRHVIISVGAAWAAAFLQAADGTWINSGSSGGDWSVAGNWASDTPASGSGSTAFFTTGSGTVNNDVTDLALLGVQLSGAGFTLAGNTLTLDSAGFITVLGGSHAVNLPLALSGGTALEVASGQTLTLGGALSGAGGLTVYGGRVVLGNAANAYQGATIHKTGILEVASVDALGDSSADSANLVLGEGTFRYTGPSATLERGYTLIPGVSSNRAAVIDVTDAAATLTVAGRVLAPGGSFIKTGEGTLAYTYPGYQELNKSKLSNKENGVITYDVNGVAATNEYAAFTVEKGRLILGAPGQTNVINSGSGWIGCKTLASPRMDIIGGVTRFQSGWLSVGRGTGTAAFPQSPSLHIRDSAVYFEGSGLCLDNANGVNPHRCRPVLTISNSLVQATQNYILGEHDSVTGRVDVGAGSHMICNQQTDHRYGMQVAQSYGPNVDMAVTFDGASTNSTYLLRVNQGGKLTYKGNSVLVLDHTPTQLVMSTSLQSGLVRFDGATLRQRTPQRLADWLINHTNLLVGANGMTLHTDSRAWLDNALLPDPSSPGGSATKTGAGTLALGSALKVPLTVSEGAVALAVNNVYTNTGPTPAYTFAPGTAMDVSGINALRDFAFASGAVVPRLDLYPNTFVQMTDSWTYNGSAMRRRDGLLLLTRDFGNEYGSAFLNLKRDVSVAWTAEFAWRVYSTSATPADGFALVLQNDARGPRAIGQQATFLGYGGAVGNRITNSLAIGFDIYNQRLYLGTNGVWASAFAQTPDLRSAPAYIAVSHDGAGTMTVRIRSLGNDYSYSLPAALTAAIGSTEAYVGLSAGTGGSPGIHSISAFTFDAGAPSGTAVRYGGSATLAASGTLSAVLRPTARQNGFVLGNLTHVGGSVLDVSTDPALAAAPSTIDVPPPLTEQSLWRLNGTARWKADGAVATSTNAVNQGPGSVFTLNRYPISGSWTARFHYDVGNASGLPADYFCFMLQNESQGSAYVTDPPASGLSVQWRYYDGAIHSTRLKICTNGTTTVITDALAPVSITNRVPVDFTVAYDDVGHAITVTSVQAGIGTNTTVIPNVNLPFIMKGAERAYVGFLGRTGGEYTENIISDFSFERTGGAEGAVSDTPYLAFSEITGTGSLVKRGNAALGLVGDIDHATSNLSVRLEEGGLVLRKSSIEPFGQSAGARSDWVLSTQALWTDDSTLQPCPYKSNVNGTVTTVRRVRVSDAWTASFTFQFGQRTVKPAEAFCFFLHNDPRGPGYSAGNTSMAGFEGMANSIGLRWFFYPDYANTESIILGRNGAWVGSYQKHTPIAFTNGPTDIVLSYNPGTTTLTSVMKQGALCVTNSFTDVDIPAQVKSDYAYLGFGGGTGGSYAEMRVRDIRFSADAPTDATAGNSYLADLAVADGAAGRVTLESSLVAGTYTLAAATVGDGATLAVDAALQPGTLAVAAATLTGGAAFSPAAGCTLALGGVSGGSDVQKLGAGTLALTGAAAYAGDTFLTSGTLALDAARLPATTDLHVTSGATLNLAFTGKQFIHALFVDGAPMPGGQYTAAKVSWITGPGTLVVTYPPVGTALMLR